MYGSEHAQDIKMFGVNDAGLVNIDELSGHPDAAFRVKKNTDEKFLAPTTGAALFTATAVYNTLLPGSSPIVMTAGSTAAGGSAPESSTHKGGRHIDIRYVGSEGNFLTGISASAKADVARMKVLFDAFKREGLRSALTGTPKRFGFEPYDPTEQRRHRNHVHLQYTYPKWPR